MAHDFGLCDEAISASQSLGVTLSSCIDWRHYTRLVRRPRRRFFSRLFEQSVRRLFCSESGRRRTVQVRFIDWVSCEKGQLHVLPVVRWPIWIDGTRQRRSAPATRWKVAITPVENIEFERGSLPAADHSARLGQLVSKVIAMVMLLRHSSSGGMCKSLEVRVGVRGGLSTLRRGDDRGDNRPGASCLPNLSRSR